MSYKEIFDFNPLSAIFLSGFATQLYVLICYNKQRSNNNKIPTELFRSSEKRIKRWNKLFIEFCMNHYEEHLLDHERDVLKTTTTHNGVLTNPFYVHASMLIQASRKVIAASKVAKVSDKPDKPTQNRISAWFTIIKKVMESSLGKAFDKNSAEVLLDMAHKRESEDEDTEEEEEEEDGNSSYPHFSPGALFIRTSCIVYMQKSKMDRKLFKQWETTNAIILSDVMLVLDFLKEAYPNKEEYNSDHNHGTPFPYIHRLPCKSLFQLWDSTDQITVPIPVGEFFKHVLNCIGGNAITYHQHQASNIYNPKSEEGIVTYEYYLQELFTLVKYDTAAVKNAEKQRKFQAMKKRKRGKTMRNSVEAIHMLTTPFDNEISLNFLFGIHNNLLNPFQTKYYVFHQSKVAC